MSTHRCILQMLVAAALIVGAGAPISSALTFAAEKAVVPERNPPGDIPDSQVFIDYAGNGFSMKVPEGWSRKDTATGAVFSDKYNMIEISTASAAAAPTVESVQKREAADIASGNHAAKITDIGKVKLNGGSAIRIRYQFNSDPNAVTGKKIRLDCVRYLYFKDGNLVILDMAAPAGADNVDQWLLMANSMSLK